MLTASFIAIFVVPASFYLFEKLAHREGAAKVHATAPEPHPATQKGGEHV
jgi:hypothetical protein